MTNDKKIIKYMKTINKYLVVAIALVASTAFFTSCEDEDKARIPSLDNGGFVKFVTQPEFYDGTENAAPAPNNFPIPVYLIGENPSTAVFTALAEDPNGNVANYDVRVAAEIDGTVSDTVAFRSTTTFPFDLSFTTADMASLFNVNSGTFQEGDQFDFIATVTTDDGRVYTSLRSELLQEITPEGDTIFSYNGGNTDDVILNVPGYLQAMNWRVRYEEIPVEE